jgi:threonylcarbamoyladenosine tRNA methylthiotransferase MtaB
VWWYILMTTEVITFGCRLNSYESEAIKEKTAHLGTNQKLVIFNTCAVTKEAERQAKQAIRKYKRDHPEAMVVVTGCAAQVNPDQFSKMTEVHTVLGNQEKMQSASYAHLESPNMLLDKEQHERIQVNDIMSIQETASHLVGGFEGKARAFVQIQNGCNHRCTFCIIPYGRGNSRSVPLGEIVDQVRLLLKAGYQEIILTGVDITDYGLDLPGQVRLGAMVRRLLTLVPELERIRFSSLDVAEMDDELFHLLATEPRIMPHVHLSVQAGDDMILKRMKRRHLRAQVIETCRALRAKRPDIVFGADLIAGFPTETEEMFEQTMRLVEEADLTFLHVFPYSEREGTPAARMPAVPKAIRKERAARLRALGQLQLAALMRRQSGLITDILVEEGCIARTPWYTEIILPEGINLQPGTIHHAQLYADDRGILHAELIVTDA